MDFTNCSYRNGKLTALNLIAHGDTGAYLSVGITLLERIAWTRKQAGLFISKLDLPAETFFNHILVVLCKVLVHSGTFGLWKGLVWNFDSWCTHRPDFGSGWENSDWD